MDSAPTSAETSEALPGSGLGLPGYDGLRPDERRDEDE